MKYTLLALLLFAPLPAFSQYYYAPRYCRPVYDEYGNYIGRGCSPVTQEQPQVYCDPSRTLIGGLLGTAVGGALSRGNGRYWAMPLSGAIGAATIGCGRY